MSRDGGIVTSTFVPSARLVRLALLGPRYVRRSIGEWAPSGMTNIEYLSVETYFLYDVFTAAIPFLV